MREHSIMIPFPRDWLSKIDHAQVIFDEFTLVFFTFTEEVKNITIHQMLYKWNEINLQGLPIYLDDFSGLIKMCQKLAKKRDRMSLHTLATTIFMLNALLNGGYTYDFVDWRHKETNEILGYWLVFTTGSLSGEKMHYWIEKARDAILKLKEEAGGEYDG